MRPQSRASRRSRYWIGCHQTDHADHLCVVDVPSGATPLPEADTALPAGWEITAFLAFSPQGDRILYATSDAEFTTAALWSIGVDGSNPHLVAAGPTQGDWSSR